ncbi:MAG: AAA family ATPase [Planctomycetaceae bacterium]|nr:AAA family ATPase [Planctomycetaceae bacterium]
MITQGKVVEKQIFDAIASVLGKQRFDLWVGQKTGVRVENDKVIFSVQKHVIDWVRSSLRVELEGACAAVLNKKPTIEFVVSEELPDNFVSCGQNNFVNNINKNVCSGTNQITREIYFESGGTVIPSEPHLPVSAHKISIHTESGNSNIAQSQITTSSTTIIANTQNLNSINTNDKISTTGLTSSRSGTQSRYVTSSTGSPISNIPRSKCRQFASLDTFVEGLSNRLALRGIEFALDRSCLINPIYIYGPNGVGKTHLLEGVWSKIRSRAENKSPLYMTAEQFVAAFLDSIQSGSSRNGTQNFRERFKGISHFLLDDIQSFCRKEATQTEFLYVMDLLKPQNIQIVLTGDRSLSELGLRNEIISRLESGMSCGIELPERDLLLKVLLAMVKRRGMKLGEDVCRFICSRVGMNVRRISGALNRLFVFSADGEDITVEKAEEILRDMFLGVQRDVRLSDIGKIVSEEFGLIEGVLQSRDRSRQVNVPRMLAMWLARKYTRFALSEIGRYFGDRSHSTVITAQKKVDQWLSQKNLPNSIDQNNNNIIQTIQDLERKLSGI